MKVTITKDFRNIKRMVPLIRDRYSKNLRTPLKLAILKDISRGVSPVKGKGKFKKYSRSYKDSIRGLVQFFTITTGGVKKSNCNKNNSFC